MPGTAGGLRAKRLDRSLLGLEPGGLENVTDTGGPTPLAGADGFPDA